MIKGMPVGSPHAPGSNIILNHDFSSGGLFPWYPNSCDAFVVTLGSHTPDAIVAKSGHCYAVVTGRTESWQGLEQDISEKVFSGITYVVTACVRLSGALEGSTAVQATLKLDSLDSSTIYLCVGRTVVSREQWEKMEGTFSLTSKPNRIIIYLEGPPAGVDLLIDSVMIFPESHKQFVRSKEMGTGLQNYNTSNIILNHDFSEGLVSWHPNNCDAHVVSPGTNNSTPATSRGHYAVVTRRTECWQGLEQDITGKVSSGITYSVSARVRVSGAADGSTAIQATLKTEYPNTPMKYLFIGRVSVTEKQWEKLEGTFCLQIMPKRVILYLEGPPPGVDLLIGSVVAFPSGLTQIESDLANFTIDGEENIIQNANFADGLKNWFGRGCKILLHDSLGNGVLPFGAKLFASATGRTQSWNGIQQEITDRVRRKFAYEITAAVRIFGSTDSAKVQATLWFQTPNGREEYIRIAEVQASDKEWVQLHGKFLLNSRPLKAVIYLEGPPSGTDILLYNLVVKRAKKIRSSYPPDFEIISTRSFVESISELPTNIILNSDFSDGLRYWHPNSCDGHVYYATSAFLEGVNAKSGRNYAFISNRTESWQGLEQDITEGVRPNSSYTVSAWVSFSGGALGTSEIQATIKLEYLDSTIRYMPAGRVLASNEQWVELVGSFSLNDLPKQVVFFLEGPSPGLNLLVHSVTISHSIIKRPKVLFGENIIENSCLRKELSNWFPMGTCTLKVCTGSPRLLPSVARETLAHDKPLSGHYILATNRTETWMGPAQTVTERIILHLTYQVSAWVRVGTSSSAQQINIALNVDSKWINVADIEVTGGGWHEIAGSFRIETQPTKAIIYLQGPLCGVDLMVAGLQMFPVDRIARFKHLKEQTGKVRKRDVILRFTGSQNHVLFGSMVKVRQIRNSFPFGSCIGRSNLDNEDFIDFFVKNFNWAVFGNELKWYHTEAQRGNLSYRDADEMLDFCERHGIATRGHCIFWEVEDAVPSWVRSLNRDDLLAAINGRLTTLLTRYRSRFRHYDVNNEMLHGSFFRDKLGKDIHSHMFKVAKKIDPSAMLFVNDYHVEDGCDAKSSPEKYIEHVLSLQEHGAPVDGIGLQCHVDHPVGPIICSALDKLAALGLPIWFTELDVSAINEHVRADDLEVILREAYAHPAVEGIVLWGFWEMFMCRDHSHLVDAEGDVNEAGKRFLALKREWLSNVDGPIDEHGEFRFRGFHGTYNLEIATPSRTFSQIFVVDKGESPLVLDIHV